MPGQMVSIARAKISSIRQPWASLIVHGIKLIENRTWATTFRGPLLIHAGLQWDKDAPEVIASIKVPRELPTGGIIGVCELVDIVTESDDPFFFGPFGWKLADPRKLPMIEMKGRLGLFDPPPHVLERLLTTPASTIGAGAMPGTSASAAW